MSRLCSPLFGLLLAVFVVGPISVRGQEVLDGPAGEVASYEQKEVISFSEVREMVGPAERQAHNTLKGQDLVEKVKEIRLAAIHDLIDRKVILQYARAKGFSVPDQQVDDGIDGIVQKEFGGDWQAFLHSLAVRGYTLEKFRELQRDTMIVEGMRKQAGEGAPNAEARKEQEAEWLEGLRKKAYIKIF